MSRIDFRICVSKITDTDAKADEVLAAFFDGPLPNDLVVTADFTAGPQLMATQMPLYWDADVTARWGEA